MPTPAKPRGLAPNPRQDTTPASPWAFDGAGRTASVAGAAKVRQFLLTYLFTAPGERVNRPTYGAGAMRLVFGGATQVELALRRSIEGGLTEEMNDLIDVLGVESEVIDSRVRVTVRYRLRLPGATDDLRATFEQPLPS
jgi:hypothetical protein